MFNIVNYKHTKERGEKRWQSTEKRARKKAPT